MNKRHVPYFILAGAMLAIAPLAIVACSSAPPPAGPASSVPAVTSPAAPPASSRPTPSSGTTATTPNSRQGQGASGTLAKIDGNTLTLTSGQGQVIVTVGSNTSIQKTMAGTVSDLSVGASVSVFGTAGSNGNISATSITLRPQGQGTPPSRPAGQNSSPGSRPNRTDNSTSPGPAAGRITNGTITKVDASTLTLDTTQGQVTATMGPQTSILKTLTVSVSDLKTGDTVTAIGAPDANGNINATSILVRPQGQSVPDARPGA